MWTVQARARSNDETAGFIPAVDPKARKYAQVVPAD
jgi:hypothetical protein